MGGKEECPGANSKRIYEKRQVEPARRDATLEAMSSSVPMTEAEREATRRRLQIGGRLTRPWRSGVGGS